LLASESKPSGKKKKAEQKLRLKQKLEIFFRLRPGTEEAVTRKYQTTSKKKSDKVNLRKLEELLDITFGYEYVGGSNPEDYEQIEKEILENIITAEHLIKYEDLKFLEKIGEGAYAEVYKCEMNGEIFAVKVLKSVGLRHQQLRIFAREVGCLRRVAEVDKAVNLKGACVHPKCCIVLEFYCCGSVEDLLKTNRKLSLQEALSCARDVAEAMKELHSMKPPLIHRDISCQNILLRVDVNGDIIKAVLSDFGIARCKEQKGPQLLSPLGHPRYRAPEITSKHPYTKKVDVYCFGSSLYELVTGQKVMEGLSDIEVCRLRLAGKIPTIPPTVPKGIAKLILSCWDLSPKRRPSFKEILRVLEKKLRETSLQPGPRS